MEGRGKEGKRGGRGRWRIGRGRWKEEGRRGGGEEEVRGEGWGRRERSEEEYIYMYTCRYF